MTTIAKVRVSGTGASNRTISSKLQELLSVKDFGAVGDGTTDDTTALQTAFAQTGRTVFVPAGTYRYTSSLVPACEQIIGEGEFVSILKPDAGVTIALSITRTTDHPKHVEGIQLNGVNTTSATGLFFGNGASTAVNATNIRVLNFTGSGAIGVRFGDVLKSTFNKISVGSCVDAFVINPVTASFSTTLTLINCVASNNSGYGEKVVQCYGVKHIGCCFESSGLEGVYFTETGDAVDIGYDACWFESNNGNDTSKYHVVVGTNAGGRTLRPYFVDCYFDTSASTAKAIRLNGPSVAGFIIERPRFGAAVTGAISVENNAYGSIPSWVDACGYSTVVSDSLNRAWSPSGAWVDWVPTYASDIGNAAATFSGGTVTTAVARFKRISAKATAVELLWSATLNSVTPNYFDVSLPTNIATQGNAVYVPCMVKNSTYGAGFARYVGDNHVRFHLSSFGNFTSAAAVGGSLVAVIETA